MSSAFSPPLRRRRSSLFNRRDSFVPDHSLNGDNPNNLEDDHKAYLEKLKIESDAWKQLYKSRKSKIQDIERRFKQSENLEIINDNSLRCILSGDIKEFLRTKPDIDGIVKESIKLCEDFEITKALYDNLAKSNERIVKHVKNGTERIIECICDENIELLTNILYET